MAAPAPLTGADQQCHWAKTSIRRRVWEAKIRLHIPTMSWEEYLARCNETEFEVELCAR